MSYQARELLRDSKTLCHRLKRKKTTSISKLNGENNSSISPNAITLQRNVKIVYEKLLLLDEQFSTLHDVPMLLWKTCFYRKIEEYREIIKKHVQASLHLIPQQRDSEEELMASRHLKEAREEYISYLDNAKSYFLELLCKLQNVGSYNLHSVTIQQFHTYLGDISRYRYREIHSEQSLKDWKEAKAHYDTAHRALPDRGNPYNQLAVLATYVDEECVAAYNYCRALLCKFPFLTAKDNIVLLFQKTKQLIAEQEQQQQAHSNGGGGLVPSSTAGVRLSSRSVSKGVSVVSSNSKQRRHVALLVKTFLRRFVLAQGVILCTAQDAAMEFNSLLDAIIEDLSTLLDHSAFGDMLILRMIAVCISTVEMTSTMCEVWKVSSFIAIGGPERRAEMHRCALTLAFAVAAEVGQHVRTCGPLSSRQREQQYQNSSRFIHEDGSARVKSRSAQITLTTELSAASSESIGKCSRSSHRCRINGGSSNRKGGEVSRNGTGSGTRSGPGSRLLGPLVLFCNWLSCCPECFVAAESTSMPNNSSSLASSGINTVIEEKENSMRARFWDAICSLANALPSPPNSWVSTGVWKTLVLREHYELRGFSPLDEIIEGRFKYLAVRGGNNTEGGGGGLCGQAHSDENGNEEGRVKSPSPSGKADVPEVCDDNTAAMVRIHLLKLFADGMTTNRVLSSPLLVRDKVMGSFYVAKSTT